MTDAPYKEIDPDPSDDWSLEKSMEWPPSKGLLLRFEARQSSDIVKTDLELTCIMCGGVVCDVQHRDTLDSLVGTAMGHICAGES